MRVYPETLIVDVHPDVRSDKDYSKFHDIPLSKAERHSPSGKAL